MKATAYRILFLFLVLSIFSTEKVNANGCTGSWFNIQYSPWCQCWQVCGNYISDCDQLVSVTWNFGDGTPSVTGGSPCHVYTQNGTYTVTMTIVAYCHTFLNLWTTTCPITQQVIVTSVGPVLIAGFSADTACLGNITSFTNTTVSPPGSNNTYTWDFGDGTTGTGDNPTHTFDSCGVFDVRLIATNSAPCCSMTGRDTIIKRVYINCNPFDQSNSLGNTDPYIQESDGVINTLSGTCAGDTTRFSLNTNGPITNVLWTFPDSSTSTSLTPWYIYPACPPTIDYTYVNLTTNRGCVGIIDSITGIFCPTNIGLSSTLTLCTGQCSGTATVNMSGGGTPPYSMVWSDPSNQTSQTATGLCPGPYSVTVTDGNGCHATPPVPVTVNDFPFPFTGAATIQGNVRCNGWAGGSAVLNYTGGTPPYTTYWDNGATTPAVTGLTGGPHTVTGTDAHGCIFTTTVNISQPPPIGATITPVNAGCNLCNGSATVNPSGGNGTYVYTWLTVPVQNTQTATGLCAGVYQVIVEDGAVSGCNDTFSVAISENGAQPVTASATNAICPNICNGTATANLTGGCLNPPCTFVWLDSAGTAIGQTSGTATNLCSGDYTVQVTNASGCRSFANATVGVPNPVIPTATPIPNTCGSPCNGTITASGTGGNPGYAYQWYNASNVAIAGQTNAVINGLCAGDYSVRLTDQQGCIATAYATVLTNPLVASATATSVLCNGDCNGIVTAVVSGGRTPYSYVLQNGGTTVYSGSSSIIANMCAGSYNLIVTDAGSCSITIPLTINQPAALNPVPSGTLPLCFGNCNGTVSVIVNGGTAPYTYEWRYNTAVIGTTPSVTNRCAGSYVVKVSDVNNCVTPFIPVVLSQPALIDDTMAIIDPYCTGGQGSVDLTVTGGTSPYTYSWNNGTYNTQDISNLASGVYTVVITDANSCTHRDTATFTQLPPVTAQIIPTMYGGYNYQCAGTSNGEVKVRVNGGLPPYTYLWNDPAQSTVDSIFGLPAGVYSVTITDSHGCQYFDSVPLTSVPPVFNIGLTPSNVTCNGANDGSATLNPVGGIPPYIYYWNLDTSNISQPLTGVGPGQYTITVFDSLRCVKFDTVIISEPPPLLLSHTFTNVTCSGAANGSIDLTVSGGLTPYSYSWNGGLYTTQDLTAVTDGQYIVNVTDSSGCVKADTTVLAPVPSMVTSAVPVNVTCNAGSDGSITLTISGGNTPYSFNWNNGQYNTQNITGIAAGHYVVLATDANNCTVADSADITEPPIITGSRQVSVCITDSFFTGGAYQHTAGIYVDTLTTANSCDSVLSTNLSFINQFNTQFAQTLCFGQRYLFNGNYYSSSGTYTNTLISSGGCDSVVTLTLNVLNDIGLYASPDKATLLTGESITVNIYSLSNAEIVSYTWSPYAGITCADTICSSAVLDPDVDTRYTVVAIDSNGCRDTVVIPILVSGPVIFIPNVFTPNGDGTNDFFEVFGNKDAFRYIEAKVFDRWGEKVFESNNLNFKWDGSYRGKPMPPAVYVYTIRVVFANAKQGEKIYKGSVTLVK